MNVRVLFVPTVLVAVLAGCVPAGSLPSPKAAPLPSVASSLALQELVDVVRQKHSFPSGFVYRMESDKAVQAWETSGGPLVEISPEAAEAKAAASWDCLPSGRLRGGSSGSIRLYSPTKAVAVVGVMSDTGLFQQVMELARVGEQWQVLSDRDEHIELLPGCGSAQKSPTPPMVEATRASAMRTIVVAPTSTPAFWPTGVPAPTPGPRAVREAVPRDEAACMALGGVWAKHICMQRDKYASCQCWNLPASDAGRPCSDSRECEGRCEANLTLEAASELLAKQPEGQPLLMTGTCSSVVWPNAVGEPPTVEGGQLHPGHWIGCE